MNVFEGRITAVEVTQHQRPVSMAWETISTGVHVMTTLASD